MRESYSSAFETIGSRLRGALMAAGWPTVPAIEYLLPSFNWGTTTKGNTTTHIRTGNVRVYVKRPWYSSGDVEFKPAPGEA
jgi:hypothetical protein